VGSAKELEALIDGIDRVVAASAFGRPVSASAARAKDCRPVVVQADVPERLKNLPGPS